MFISKLNNIHKVLITLKNDIKSRSITYVCSYEYVTIQCPTSARPPKIKSIEFTLVHKQKGELAEFSQGSRAEHLTGCLVFYLYTTFVPRTALILDVTPPRNEFEEGYDERVRRSGPSFVLTQKMLLRRRAEVDGFLKKLANSIRTNSRLEEVMLFRGRPIVSLTIQIPVSRLPELKGFVSEYDDYIYSLDDYYISAKIAFTYYLPSKDLSHLMPLKKNYNIYI